MIKDPVCGMQVDEKNAAAKADYQGSTYYFCSAGCHKTFGADPAKYAKSVGSGPAGVGERKR